MLFIIKNGIIDTMHHKVHKETERKVFAFGFGKRSFRFELRILCAMYLRDTTKMLKKQIAETSDKV